MPVASKQLGHGDEGELADEIAVIKNAVATGWPPQTINLRTEGLQLAWAAAMFYLQGNPSVCASWQQPELRKKEFKETKLWQKLNDCGAAKAELMRAGRAIAQLPISHDTTIAWNYPGSWYYFSPHQKHINIDLAFSCLAGFEHSRDSIYHEIGHALLSLRYTPAMEALQKRSAEIQAIPKQQKRKLTQEEYKELYLLSFEWKLRHRIWNCLEDTSMNRFVRNQSEKWEALQDYGLSLNHTETYYGMDAELKNRFAHLDPEVEVKSNHQDASSNEAYKKLNNIGSLGLYQFFVRNGLIADTTEGYQSVDLHPEWLQPGQMDTIRQLVSEEFENTQPGAMIARYGLEARREFTKRLAAKRGTIIDAYWESLCKEHAQIILDDFGQRFDPNGMKSGGKNGIAVEGFDELLPLPAQIPKSPEGQYAHVELPTGTISLQDALDAEDQQNNPLQDPESITEIQSNSTREAIKGDLAIHYERVARMQPTIQAGRPILEELLKRRFESDFERDHERELIGDLRNLDMRATERLEELRAMGAATLNDYDRFNREEEIPRMARPRLVLIIDDSGSMDQMLAGGKKLALTADAATAIYEMTRGLSIDVYAYACGNYNPIPLIKPGYTDEEVATNMASLMKGRGCEALRPPLRQFVQDVLDEVSPYPYRGNTFIEVLSDGDIHDMDAAGGLLGCLREHTDHISLDALLMAAGKNSRMHKSAIQLTKDNPENPILVKEAKTATEVHQGILDLLTHRLEQTAHQPAFSAEQERAWLEFALEMEMQAKLKPKENEKKRA